MNRISITIEANVETEQKTPISLGLGEILSMIQSIEPFFARRIDETNYTTSITHDSGDCKLKLTIQKLKENKNE